MRFEMETDELNLVLFKISNQSIFFRRYFSELIVIIIISFSSVVCDFQSARMAK